MDLGFSEERWAAMRRNYGQWWAKELDRPIIQAALFGYEPVGQPPRVEPLSQANCHDFSVPVMDIVSRWEYDLSSRRFLGDSFPFVDLNCFGPGVLAAFLGARLDNSSGNVWFHAPSDQQSSAIHLTYDANNAWFRRLREIYQAGTDHWEGRVLMGMTDLGGTLDVLASFRPGERLLTDLLLYPNEVKRLTWDIHELWFRYYDELNKVLFPDNPGYSAWTQLFSDVPYYVLQCDFCYMIGPAQFDEFVKPELEAACARLGHSIYHLDGPGQLNHLDSILGIEALDGVQWLPGAGNPDIDQWPEVYEKIRAADKLCHVAWAEDWRLFDAVVDQLGDARGLYYAFSAQKDEEEEVRSFLKRHGVDPDPGG